VWKGLVFEGFPVIREGENSCSGRANLVLMYFCVLSFVRLRWVRERYEKVHPKNEVNTRSPVGEGGCGVGASNRFKGREVRGTFRYKKWPLEERRNTAGPFKHRTPRWWSHEEEEKRGGLALRHLYRRNPASP